MHSPSTDSQLSWQHRQLPELAKLAWPITVSMLSYSAMTLSDTLFVSRIGAAEVAGVGLGGIAAFTLLAFGFGGLRAVKVLASQAVGAGLRERVPALVGAGLVAALIITTVGLTLGQLLAPLVADLAATELQGRTARDYLWVRNLAMPLVLAGVVLREARYALGDAKAPMQVSLIANAAHIALNYLFIITFDLGAVGAAWSSVASAAIETAGLAYLQAGDGFGLRGVRRRDVLEVARLAWPIGLQTLVEMGSFTMLTIIVAGMSEIDGAAHQIAIQVIHLSFLPAFAVGEAASILVGQAVGADADHLVVRVGRKTLLLVMLYTGACGALIALIPGPIIGLFTDDPRLTETTRHLLYVAALFQVFDGMNIVGRTVLRGTGDVRVPALVTGTIAWCATPPLAWLLGRQLGWGALGGWVGLCLEIMLGSVYLWWRVESGRWHRAASLCRAELELERGAMDDELKAALAEPEEALASAPRSA
ncbi:MAG: MATE family efflux transporter [Polyangiaceae bacterium]|nr:MATE family efflux transporter [Polyangiaceae bacterium]